MRRVITMHHDQSEDKAVNSEVECRVRTRLDNAGFTDMQTDMSDRHKILAPSD